MTKTSFIKTAAIFFLAASIAQAQTTTTIVNDDFSDGISNNGANQIGFFTTSSSNALDPDQPGGPVDFATGGSGRAIHGLFAPQTLVNAGDSVWASFTFTTPATIAPNNNEVLKFGLFDTTIGAGQGNDYDQNISASSGTPNPALNLLPGFAAEIDDINAQTNASVGTSDIIIRTHNVTNDTSGIANPPSGRLLTTTGGFDNIGSADDDQFLFDPNSSYTIKTGVELTDPAAANPEFLLTVNVMDSTGALIGEHTDTARRNTEAGVEVGLNTTTFDFFAISNSSGAFGTSSTTGEADNGIDITNVTIEFKTVPEPNGAMLLLVACGSMMGLVRRRRK